VRVFKFWHIDLVMQRKFHSVFIGADCRAEHVSEAENGTERAKIRVERSGGSGERAWQKTMERERIVE